jgi:hypothetical protein
MPCGTGLLSGKLRRLLCPVIAADVSWEMMTLANEDYDFDKFQGFVQSDILTPPFPAGTFACVISIGLMHRLPEQIRQQALREIALLSNRYLLVSYSIDSSTQRFKQRLIKSFFTHHSSAPSPVTLEALYEEFRTIGLQVSSVFRPFPVLSADTIFLLEKSD